MTLKDTFVIRRSSRAKRISIQVYRDLSVLITIPKRLKNNSRITDFIHKKKNWLKKTLEKVSLYKDTVYMSCKKDEYLIHKLSAALIARERIKIFNEHYRVSYNSIRIKNQRTRWGSCSSKGNINLNFNIALLPSELADYIIVHELCHLKEFNHSNRFWKLVEEKIPNYRELRSKLKKTYRFTH